VLNVDASRGIDVDVRVGARIGSVPWIAAGIGAVGLILLLGGGVLLFVGLRPRIPSAEAVDAGSAPAACSCPRGVRRS
jgi:hypothetical protein